MLNIKQLFYWDIETAGRYPNWETFKTEDPRGANLFLGKYNKKKIQNLNDPRWNTSIQQAYENNASLICEFGRIVCISYAYFKGDELKLGTIQGEESEIIEKALIIFNQVNEIGRIVCGYNIKAFDIPWVFKKMLHYGKTPPSNISTYGKKPWEITCVDFMEIWKSSGWEAATFDEMSYSLGVPSPKSDMDGTMVHEYFHSGRIDEIATYCENDVKALVGVARKLENLI